MKPKRILLTVALLLTVVLPICGGLTACDTPDTSNDTTNATTREEPTVNDTQTEAPTEEATEETTAEIFSPDPTLSVPDYDALMSNMDTFPLSFKYGSTEYKGFAGFALEAEAYVEIDRGIQTTRHYRHPDIPALFELVATVYPEESAYEYVVYITNDGDQDTEIFANLCFEIEFEGNNPVISGIKGDAGGQNYTPYTHDLTARTRYTDTCTSGRPSHGVFPYYNLSYGDRKSTRLNSSHTCRSRMPSSA